MQVFSGFVTGVAFSLMTVLCSQAAELQMPKGQVVLEVRGLIEKTTNSKVAQFDMDTFEKIGLSSFETTTPWFDGVTRFEGVLGRDLLEAVGATGKEVFAYALDEYNVPIPIEDFLDKGLLIVSKINEERMSVRDKGPLWIIYPFDSDPSINTAVYHARSVWQLVALEIR